MSFVEWGVEDAEIFVARPKERMYVSNMVYLNENSGMAVNDVNFPVDVLLPVFAKL